MPHGRIGAILGSPVSGRPGIFVEVADAGVVGGQPVWPGEGNVEEVVHVAADHHVGIEEDDFVVGEEGKNAEFGPGVFEAGGDERDVCWGEEGVDFLDVEEVCALAFGFEGFDAFLREGVGD